MPLNYQNICGLEKSLEAISNNFKKIRTGNEQKILKKIAGIRSPDPPIPRSPDPPIPRKS
jgi:hypothetical protein